MSKLYAMSWGTQGQIIKENCFNCAIAFGVINIHGGYFAVCQRDDCPLEVETLDIGECVLDSGGEHHIIVRKLKEVPT